MGRRFLAGAVLAVGLALACAAAASARVTLVATGAPELVFLGIPDNEVVARLALPGPSRAVAITRDGRRGYVTAGGEVVAVDVNTRLERARSVLGLGPPEISDIKLSPGGETLYAVRGTQLVVLDAQTLASRGLIDLRGSGGALAVANDGGLAAVALRSGRVAMVQLGTNRLLRLVKLKGAFGVAIADGDVTYVSARGRLRAIPRGQRRPRKRPIRLPTGAGGGLTLSPARSRLVVAAAPGGGAAALVELRTGVVRRLVSGTGPGRAAWYPDASRILFADGGSASVSLISPFSRGRIGLVTLPGTTPSDVEARVRSLLGDDVPYELEWPEAMVPASSSPVDGVVPAAIAAFLEAEGDPGALLPTLCAGFTDSNYLRAAGGTHAYGFSPFRATPNEVLEAGYHNANERVHVDDLLLSTRFHLDLVRRVLRGRRSSPRTRSRPRRRTCGGCCWTISTSSAASSRASSRD